MNLLIAGKTAQNTKLWRIRPNRGAMTFGQSKHARLRYPAPDVAGMHGVFEFRDGKWWYTQLSPLKHDLTANSKDASIVIDKTTLIHFTETELIVTPFSEKPELFKSNEKQNNDSSKNDFRWVIIYRNNMFMESRLLKLDAPLIINDGEKDLTFKLNSTPDWKIQDEKSGITIKHRIVSEPDIEDLEKVSPADLIEKDQVKYIGATLTLILVLGLTILIGSSKSKENNAANTKMEYHEVTTVVKKKPKPKEDSVSKAMASAVPPKQDSNSSSPAPKNIGGVISKLRTASLSKLIAKVSSQGARSNNVIITKSGVKAGSGPSGSALAAISRIANKGQDWKGGMGGGTGTIGTVGGGTGNGAGGLGAIGNGRTGTSNVGIIENETEIAGGLDREIIAEYIKSQIGQILYCYERQLSATPDLFGKVAVKFTIGPNGDVETSRIGESSLKNQNVENCMLQKIARWRFPKPDGGTKVVVTYPFLFKSTN